jgi:hypothetical protein
LTVVGNKRGFSSPTPAGPRPTKKLKFGHTTETTGFHSVVEDTLLNILSYL